MVTLFPTGSMDDQGSHLAPCAFHVNGIYSSRSNEIVSNHIETPLIIYVQMTVYSNSKRPTNNVFLSVCYIGEK